MTLLEKYESRFPAVLTALGNARRAGRMAHAYLLHGDNHLVREEFAILVAQTLLCLNPGRDSGKPCGVCQVCDKLSRGVYPELSELRPSGKMRLIKVGDRVNPEPNTLRWFEDVFYKTTTSQFQWKIGILHDVDRMNAESQNAFLKTLEEPPRNSSFILTTGNPSALLPTTRSRCQTLMVLENRVEFDFEGMEVLLQNLRKLSFDARGKLPEAEQCCGGIMAVASSLKAQANARAEEEWQDKREAVKELESGVRKRVEEQFDSAAAAEYLRLRSIFLGAIHSWFAQLFHLASGATADTLGNPEFFQGLSLPPPDEAFALRALGHAESLNYNLRFNVDEELAVRCFCLNVALKS